MIKIFFENLYLNFKVFEIENSMRSSEKNQQHN